jgi:hypothetical protein
MATLRNESFQWQPYMDRAAFVAALRFTAIAFPLFAIGAVAAILFRSSNQHKVIGFWFGVSAGLLIVGCVGAFFLLVA